ncbi:transmembrane protein 241 [Chanos chanos]|uniref:Transmembrane protein 241 n=1 Tax=Chanos chanos TaxID=29144 RepID=A0A6J2V3F8_CHACN|nr:transmembrane protein 241 [Chanos chanos]
MNEARTVLGPVFCILYVVLYFTNKYVLSVLKFTYPTLFLGWQTFFGAVLLLVSGKLGWVELSGFPRSAVLSWLPGSLLFWGNIYGGSRALSSLPIPFFLTLHNASEVMSFLILKVTQRDRTSWQKVLSTLMLLVAAVCLILRDPQPHAGGYMWAVLHLSCVGAYKVFQRRSKGSHLSDLEQQLINYVFSALLLTSAAHPTGDLFGALEFPFLLSHKFHIGCFASALLGFCLLLASIRLKSSVPMDQVGAWVVVAKVLASGLSLFVFTVVIDLETLCCVVISHTGEALSVYAERVQDR